jgi:hypothetical protein
MLVRIATMTRLYSSMRWGAAECLWLGALDSDNGISKVYGILFLSIVHLGSLHRPHLAPVNILAAV